MYDPKTAKAEASQRSLLKIVDGGHVLADHSFDHMNHNSNDSPRNAYTNVEQDMVSCKEGYNWGHGLSAAIKIGTPEKTVGDSQLHSGVY